MGQILSERRREYWLSGGSISLSRAYSYQLAEKLSSRLDEMHKDLGSMVEEINDASSALNKTGKPDDPVSSLCIFVFTVCRC